MGKKIAYRTEDQVRDSAKIILGFDAVEEKIQQGTGQITTFNQLGFKGINDKPDGWYLPDNHNMPASITGSTTTAKLERLATQMESADGVGTYVYKVRDVLNTYTSNYDYAYYEGSTLDEFLFRVYTFNSLSYDRAPILHAKTAALSYYNGHNTGHYIAVTEFDYNTMEVRLHDPHNSNTYYGIHQVPYEEAHSSVSDYSGRYYICYWP